MNQKAHYSLLLADPSPALRYLVLKDLLACDDNDQEFLELEHARRKDPLVRDVFLYQADDGSWRNSALIQTTSTNPFRLTIEILKRLAFLGFTHAEPGIKRAIDFLLSLQNPDGSWNLVDIWGGKDQIETYDIVPLQTAFPLEAITGCEYFEDRMIYKAFDWLLEHQLEDGTWPTGWASGVYGRVAGYRKLPHSRWGCRTNTTACLACFANHPEYQSHPKALEAIGQLLARKGYERNNLGFETARRTGFEQVSGFFTYHAKYDLVYILELCAKIGLNPQENNLAEITDYIRSQMGKFGMCEYQPDLRATRWISYRIIHILNQLESGQLTLIDLPSKSTAANSEKQRRF